MPHDWFDIEISSLPIIKFWDDQEQKILKPLSYLKDLESKWILEFDLPLVEKKDISVYLDESDIISIEAKLKETYVDFKGTQSFEYEWFKKSVKLPKNVDTKNITARFINGRLTVIMPKLYKGTKIKIQ
jgi:HSP20 family protein